IDVRRDGVNLCSFQRAVERDCVTLRSAGSQDRVWHLVHGDFELEAARLRTKHGVDRIEPKRTSKVTLAIPSASGVTGLLSACLPTEHDVGLPFHLNADFFPTNDRKRVILDADYQSEWNRTAIAAAANALGINLGRLTKLLRPQHFWSFVAAL